MTAQTQNELADQQPGGMSCSLSASDRKAVAAELDGWQRQEKVQRLWARDGSLWTGQDEAKWLDWLDIVAQQQKQLAVFASIAAQFKTPDWTHAVVLGMGGSSLCPDVLAQTFGQQPGHPRLLVLDSTDPAQIRTLESAIDLTKTVFIVSSKSGSTLEPNIFRDYFLNRLRGLIGAKAGDHFVAVTDPGSSLEQAARRDAFRAIYAGMPGIGGRYSALSNFGMVPAAAAGLDVGKLLERAGAMAHQCAAKVPARENPGVVLGTILGVLGRSGRDKVTLVASPPIASLGAWLEQLLAESTGKQGKGLIPVDEEPLGDPTRYGQDRTFAYLRLEGGVDARQEAAIDALRRAGQPVLTIALADRYDLAKEFFRWEIATAVAGSVIGIDAFNQPDVEASKVETRKLTSEYEEHGKLPSESPIFSDRSIRLFADPRNAQQLAAAVGQTKSLAGYLQAHLARVGDGDYVALLAYIERNARHAERLQAMRLAIRDSKRVATCVGFGPRFLHSTGQAYKGGPNSGVFLQITCDDVPDLDVPGHRYTFGVVKLAQARGDFDVLAQRGRRALRVHLGSNVEEGLCTLGEAVASALA